MLILNENYNNYVDRNYVDSNLNNTELFWIKLSKQEILFLMNFLLLKNLE